MQQAGLVGGFVITALVLAGCLGATGGDPGDDDGIGAEAVEIDASGADGSDATPSSGAEDGDEAGVGACEGVRENVTALLEAKHEDPFGDREPLEPRLDACGDQGAFLLAAHGLAGEALVELTFAFPKPASCEGYTAAAAMGGHHRFQIAGWDHVEQEPTVGIGTARTGSEVFVGPLDSRELVQEENGTVAWGGSLEIDPAAGEHSYVAGANGWGAWEAELTEGAALLHILVCDGSFSFEGVQSASTLHLFSHHDMGQGAGAGGPVDSGASAGQALDVELEEEARLRAGAFTFEGAGAMQIADAETEERHAWGPRESLGIVRDVPEGPLSLTQARGGSPSVIAGAVYADVAPVAADAILGAS